MTKDVVSAGVLVGMGVVSLMAALGYEFGDAANPRPGFFPTLVALALIGTGAALLLVAVRSRGGGERLAALGGNRTARSLIPAVALVGLVVAYLLIVRPVGFLLASAVLVMALMRSMGQRSWVVTVLTSVATSGILYWLFWVQMRVPIPRGTLWGW